MFLKRKGTGNVFNEISKIKKINGLEINKI